MKRYVCLAALACILVSTACHHSVSPSDPSDPSGPPLVGGSWVTVGSPNLSSGGVDQVTMAIDSNDTPYVAYLSGANQDRITVAKWDGSAWATVGDANFSGNYAYYLSLAFMSGGDQALIAYTDGSAGGAPTVMQAPTFAQPSWRPLGTVQSSAQKGANWTSLAVSPVDALPWLAYADTSSDTEGSPGGNELTVMRYSAGTWNPVGSTHFTGTEVSFVSLAFDNSGYAWVAYFDEVSQRVNVQRYSTTNGTGGVWESRGTDISEGAASFVSLSFDGAFPYVAFQDDAHGGKVSVMTLDGEAWVYAGGAGFSGGSGSSVSLDISAGGMPVVAFQDGSTASKGVSVMAPAPDWSILGGTAFSGGQAADITLAIDGEDYIYVAYKDYANAQGVTVKRFVPE